MCVWFEHVLEYAEELRLNVYNRQSQFMGKLDSVDLMIADDLDAFMINQKPTYKPWVFFVQIENTYN